MKKYHLRRPNTAMMACCLLVFLLVTQSCRKENTLEPSKLDQNYFVIHDNPDDPIDHSIYEFYKKTGIASYYTDTLYKKKIGNAADNQALYSYIKLSLSYSPLGLDQTKYFTPLSSRNNIPSVLTLMQAEMIPKLPSAKILPSILFVDSLADAQRFGNIQISHGWTALYGFNTVAIEVKNVSVMNSEERKMYVASMLAGIAIKKINDIFAVDLQSDFFSISRASTKSLFSSDIYEGIPFMFFLAPDQVPLPQNIGLLFHPVIIFGDMQFESAPRESDDIRAFLTAAFYYTNEEFTALYPNKTLVQKKFQVIRNFAKAAGFKMPE